MSSEGTNEITYLTLSQLHENVALKNMCAHIRYVQIIQHHQRMISVIELYKFLQF